ncbi:MAG: hypothetical protein IIC04_03420 [Proteobacteria bacterium]|nr:hypothetical protein [Pseudomonadota bacterium]
MSLSGRKEADPLPADKPRVTPKGAAKARARRRRLACALRENLKKRKRQARARKAPERDA